MVNKGVVAAVIGVLLAACGTQAAVAPTPSAVATPTPVASPSGGPVPAQLLGDWFLPGGDAAPIALNPPSTGGPPCPKPYSSATCYFQLTLAATTYLVHIGAQALVASGNAVVNNDEIDVFGGANCDGVGRYKWAVSGGVVSFTLISDPCGRSDVLTYQSWSRTH